MGRADVSDKGKQIATYEDDFSYGLIDLSSLYPIQALKLDTLSQAKASEDFLKSHSEDKELITLSTDVLENILPTFKQDTTDTPSSKLRNMLHAVDSHFVSLEKVTDIIVWNIFNAIRLQSFFKVVEDDRAVLQSTVKSIEHALDEGNKIYKSCLILSEFTLDIDKKIKEYEGKLAAISQTFSPHSVFASILKLKLWTQLTKSRAFIRKGTGL